jgi:hypothetical protein
MVFSPGAPVPNPAHLNTPIAGPSTSVAGAFQRAKTAGTNPYAPPPTPFPRLTATPPAGYRLEKLSDGELGLVMPGGKAAILLGCGEPSDIQAWTTDGFPVIKGVVYGPFDLGAGSATGLWHRLDDPRLQLRRCPRPEYSP